MSNENQIIESSDTQENEENDLSDNQFLTFQIENEQYGVPIEHVTEIIEVIKITSMPEMPNYIKGIINLRGKIIPVMDVRLRFFMDEKKHDEKTCIIVVKTDELEMGLIVDTVSEVRSITSENIQDPPRGHASSNKQFTSGIGKVKDEVVIILNLQGILFEDEQNRLKKMVS